LREETSALSDIAKRPLRMVRTTMSAICKGTPSIAVSFTRRATVLNPPFIHPTSWKGYSANFASWVFSEVLLHDQVLDGAGSGLAGGAPVVFLV
jgi:uncharacterized protein (DUF1800 family)